MDFPAELCQSHHRFGSGAFTLSHDQHHAISPAPDAAGNPIKVGDTVCPLNDAGNLQKVVYVSDAFIAPTLVTVRPVSGGPIAGPVFSTYFSDDIVHAGAGDAA
jgi:hypothetical protein